MEITVLYNVFTTTTGDPDDLLADEDSVITAKEISEALGTLGHKTSLFEITNSNLDELKKLKTDLVFNQAFGIGGKLKSEAEVVELLDKFGLKYTGSGKNAIDLSNDKVASKYLFLKNKIPTAKFLIVDNPENIKGFRLKFPVILKLTTEHSSIGLDETNIVSNLETLKSKAIELFDKYHQDILVEEYIDGAEINACVLGDEVLPLSEITFGPYFASHPKIVDFKAKWKENDPAYKESVGICPALIDDVVAQKIAKIAKEVHSLSGCRGYSRVDFRIDQKGNPFVLEVNANPGLGPGDGAVRSAKAAGYTYATFLERIAQLAL